MDSNTMQLVAVTDTESGEPESGEPMHQRWHLFSPRQPKKHRIQDLVARLRGDLKRSQDLNEELGDALKDALARNVDLEEQVAKLTEKLRVAEESNRVNAMGVDFTFAQRPIDGPEDQATMPVPMVQLLDDGELKVVAADAATALLDRVVPKEVKAIGPVVHVEPAPVHGNATEDPWGLADEDDAEVYDTTASSWHVRQTVSHPPVSWGAPTPRQRVIPADMSSTGTFRVVPLQHRGPVGPTTIPGLSA